MLTTTVLASLKPAVVRIGKAWAQKAPSSRSKRRLDSRCTSFPVKDEWSSLFFLLQTLQIGKEVVNIRLSEFVEQFAVGSERIFDLDLHAISREGPIPT